MCGRLPRRPGPRAGALALLAAALLALAGCGGGGSSGSGSTTQGGGSTQSGGGSTQGAAPSNGQKPSRGQPASPGDEQLIRSSIDGVLASRDPASVCDRYTTAAFIQGAYGDRNGCAAAVSAPGEAARSVRVSAVSVSGAKATAVAVPAGGSSNRERIHVNLVNQGGVWKVDSLASNAAVGP